MYGFETLKTQCTNIGLFNRPFVPPKMQMLSYSVVAYIRPQTLLSYTLTEKYINYMFRPSISIGRALPC